MKVTNQKVLEKLSKARAVMVLDHPFFASCALRLKFIEDLNCQTLWTDGVYIGYNPEFVESLSFKKTLGVIAHETLHPAFLHPFRRDNRDFLKWNMAADYAINGILVNAKFQLPDGCLINPAYDGMSAEQIYPLLPDDGQGKGQGQGQGSLDGNGDVGNCGVCRDAPNPLDPNKPASEAQNNEMAQDWKITAKQAQQQAKAMGNCPGGIDRIIKELTEPKADWRELLHRFMDNVAKNDYRWTPPNRRYIYQNVYYPSLYSEEIGEIFFVMDTSGSVTEEELKQFASEINSILDTFSGMEITVLYCDTQVAAVQSFSSEDLPIELKPRGGGGTDFRPPFKWIIDNHKDPVCLIYLTDLECDRYPNEPNYPVLWAKIGKHGSKPPFGEIIKLK